MTLRIKFAPRNVWVGVYVAPADYATLTQSVYIALVPCFPIVVTWPVRAYR